VDALFENAIIISYLLLIGVFIILIHIKEDRPQAPSGTYNALFWYKNILQFLFGGVFSAYLILYFRSADIFVTWPFITLLALVFIANEFLKEHYVRLSIQISLFFLAIYSFTIFIVPVLIHKIGTLVFILSGFISLALIFIFCKILALFIKDKFTKSKRLLFTLITGIFFLLNFLYFTNLIPPIPLSLKDAGMYHSVQKDGAGNYEVTYEDLGWKKYLTFFPTYREVQGLPVYALSVVFSPKNLNIDIVHEWQFFDVAAKRWKTELEINLHVVGGRGGGFRTYSARKNLDEGKWRVNIKTKQGQTIGRIRFKIVKVDTEPELTATIK